MRSCLAITVIGDGRPTTITTNGEPGAAGLQIFASEHISFGPLVHALGGALAKLVTIGSQH